jgi:hypothetical protein
LSIAASLDKTIVPAWRNMHDNIIGIDLPVRHGGVCHHGLDAARHQLQHTDRLRAHQVVVPVMSHE